LNRTTNNFNISSILHMIYVKRPEIRAPFIYRKREGADQQ